MTAPLVQRLSLVVDAATGGTETRMDALAASTREAGEAAEHSAGQVAAAAERVAAAQLKRDDAADKVVLAERRLIELQEKGKASASQMLAAEQRLEASRRQLAVATRQLETAEAGQVAMQARAAEATARAATQSEHARAGAERFGSQLEGLGGVAKGLAAFELGDWLKEQTQGFLEGARGANALSIAMNATTEEGGRLSQLFASMGLEADDLLEIQAQFATTGRDGLTAMGTELKHNRDGTVNWANSLVDTLEELQKIPDATERNRLGFQMFGEEGYKQLSRLLTSGMSVEDAMAAIGTPFTDEDIAITQQYDRDMQRLSLSGDQLGRTIARNVVPAMSSLTDVSGKVLGAVTSIPLPLTLAAAAAITMGRTGFDPLSRSGDFLRDRFTRLRESISTAASGAEEGAGRMARAASVSRAAGSGLVSGLGGPVGVALVSLGLASAAAEQISASIDRDVHRAVTLLAESQAKYGELGATAEQAGRRLAEQAGIMDKWVVSSGEMNSQLDKQGGFTEFANTATGGLVGNLLGLAGVTVGADTAAAGYTERINKARKELGEFGAQQEVTRQTSQSLNNLIAEGATDNDAFSTAVADAAKAQADQTRTSDTATAAIAAYHAQTDGATQAVLGLLNAQLSSADADFAFLQSMDAANAARDDSKTSINEVAQAQVQLQEAALRAAQAAGDAAVQQAQAAGEVITPLDEARIRADAMITDLRNKLNTPGLSKEAQRDLTQLTQKLQLARRQGDVKAMVTLTGAEDAAGTVDTLTKNREAHIFVSSRNGPATADYLERIANKRRLSQIRIESRNGPAVDKYVDLLAKQRQGLIRVETRNGAVVKDYLDGLVKERTAVINIQRGGTGAAPTGTGLGAAGRYGDSGDMIVHQLTVQVQADAGGRLTQQSLAEAGRQAVTAIRAYERRNGPGWRAGGAR